MLQSTLQDGLIARLSAISGVVPVKWEKSTVVPGMAIVRPSRIGYNATMGRGSDDVDYSIKLIASRADTESGLAELYEFISGHGDRSVRTALEASLGADDPLNECMIRVDEAEIGTQSAGDANYLTATFAVATTIDGV